MPDTMPGTGDPGKQSIASAFKALKISWVVIVCVYVCWEGEGVVGRLRDCLSPVGGQSMNNHFRFVIYM